MKTIKDVLDNPSDYTEGERRFAEYMKEKFENHGTVKYDVEGLETVLDWLKGYLEIDAEGLEYIND